MSRISPATALQSTGPVLAALVLVLAAAVGLTQGCGRSCDGIEDDARAAIAEHQTCVADSDCTAVLVGGSCISGLECWAPIAMGGDQAAVQDALMSATDERRSSGCDCATPRCSPTPPAVSCSMGACAFVR